MTDFDFLEKPSTKANWLKQRPIAHRGLHDASTGIYENTLSAVKAAVARDYNIEVDLQISADRIPYVFHDYELERLTGVRRNFRECGGQFLETLKISGTEERIPHLSELLETVNGKVGLVLELKGMPGSDDGFVAAVAKALESYNGKVAVMSFDAELVYEARQQFSSVPVGLTAEGGKIEQDRLVRISRKANVDFMSYWIETVEDPLAQAFRMTGRPLITWTVRSAEQKVYSDKFADQPTFEGFLP